MNKLLDLRFVIGLFFTIIGLLLLMHSFLYGGDVGGGTTINRYTGLVFLAFGIFMVILSFQKNAHDEILDEPRE